MAAALRSGLLGNHVLIARKCYRIVFQSAAFLATETGNNEQRQCKGINYFKDGSDPPLLSDSEYPDWLWDILTDEKKRSRDEELPHDLSNVTLRRRKNKQLRRQENATRKQNN
ncbi:hypothetical protein P5673_013920 [Acropora cervicornis]|uniref:Large ribosomal subunit protein mL54 n=1 Tax=Acropora cervicornis TaxID=6130 RepID=A0AAD9V6V5_ACRCE|nr:hypothetical protein P5673_013920 [Acropora cervicornis]